MATHRRFLAPALGALLCWLAGGVAGGEVGPLPRMLPAFALTDQWGTEVGSRQLRGKVWVAGFLTAECTEPCAAVSRVLETLQQD